MKIRQGFVSNSSTTSFCIYGVGLENWPDTGNSDYDDDDGYGYDKCEWWYNKAREIGLEHHRDPYDGGGWIGLSLTQMDMDETRREFQERVDKLLTSIGLSGDGIYEEAWRDG